MRSPCVYPLACLFTACLLLAQENSSPEAKKTAVDDKAVRGLIRQLGDTDFVVREAAHKRLSDIGEPALELLKSAAKENSDFEVKQRLGQIMKSISDSFFVELRRFERPRGFTHRLAVTPDGKQVVAVSYGALRCLNVADGKESVQFEFPANVTHSWAFGLAPDGQRVITGSDDRIVRVFELKTGKLIKELKGHNSQLWGTALFFDGKRALTGASDKTLRVWDVESGKELRRFDNVPDHVMALTISPDSKVVAVAHSVAFGEPGSIVLWDLESGRSIRTLTGHTKRLSSIRFSADGKTLVSSSFDKTVRLWDVAKGKLLKTFEGHTDHAEGAIFTPDGKRVISVGDQNNPVVMMWDIASGALLYQSAPVGAGFLDVALLADERQFVTCGKDGAIRVWQWKR